MSLDTIVSVTISASSKTPTRRGFGVPLLLSYHTRFAERYRKYTAPSVLSDMIADGFTVYDDAYRMAAAVMAQNPAPKEVIVGRLPSAPSYVTDITVTDATEGNVLSFKIIEPTTGTVQTISRTIAAASSTGAEATAIELLTEAVTGVDSSVAGSTISITPTVAGRRVHIYDLSDGLTIADTTADAGYDTELAALLLENQDWYHVCIDTGSAANIADVAAWCLSNKRVFWWETANSAELGASGAIGSALASAENGRAFGIYSAYSHEFKSCRWAGSLAASTPGQVTAAYRALTGSTADVLTSTEKSYLEGDLINYHETIAGYNVTQPGKGADGEWIDITIGLDALESRIKENVWAVLVAGDKVPYTEAGMDLIVNAVKAACKTYEGTQSRTGLLAAGSTVVEAPELADIDAADKASRTLNNVVFSATLEGAIHKVNVVGTVTV